MIYFCQSAYFIILSFYHKVLLRMNPFSIELIYFLSLSSIGFGVLKVLKPRTHTFTPTNLDLFFTSVSAATVSSMSTVEMEVFSNPQLLILTLLMFIGGEVFTSMVGIHLELSKLKKSLKNKNNFPSPNFNNHVELSIRVPNPNSEVGLPTDTESFDGEYLKYNSKKILGYVVLGYLLTIIFFGVVFVLIYVTVISSAKYVLKNKGLNTFTFSLFTAVSTFSSCGFVPTNENMIVFIKNSGLLLILIPQALLGNTLFPPCLRFSIWFMGKFVKKVEANYLLKNTREMEYLHLLPGLYSSLLVVTVLGFILVGFIFFCCMEWDSTALSGLNIYEKVVGVFFQVVNARHAGESIVNLSTIAPAILVMFVVMMYLPPYTSFIPVKGDEQCPEECERGKKRRGKVMANLIFSQLSYLAIFIILICITERKKMIEDPLNFNVLNIVVEVISAYGNVGFSTGYSCELQLKPDGNCKDKWYGFSGKWSDEGKILLIVVMFFGRLKKFNMEGGRAWKLL